MDRFDNDISSSVTPVNDHFIYNGTLAWQHVVGAIKLLADGADWWDFYMVGALGGKLYVVYQICAAEHDIILFSRGDTCIFPNWVTYVFLVKALSVAIWVCSFSFLTAYRLLTIFCNWTASFAVQTSHHFLQLDCIICSKSQHRACELLCIKHKIWHNNSFHNSC